MSGRTYLLIISLICFVAGVVLMTGTNLFSLPYLFAHAVVLIGIVGMVKAVVWD